MSAQGGRIALPPALGPRRRIAWTAWVLIWIAPLTHAEDVKIAAASDLRFALHEIAGQFYRHTGTRIRPTFGSSGDLTRLILEGAPFELFLSADEHYVERLVRGKRTQGEGINYARGHIVIFVPKGGRINPDLGDVRQALADGRLHRFAIANPAHAPYGRAAREVLLKAGIWNGVQERLVLGENAAQAMQFLLSGSVDAGIVPLSLAIAPSVAARGRFAIIAEDAYAPLRQRMVLLRGASQDARRFYRFLQNAAARRLLTQYGFSVLKTSD